VLLLLLLLMVCSGSESKWRKFEGGLKVGTAHRRAKVTKYDMRNKQIVPHFLVHFIVFHYFHSFPSP
jgi:hypothetical protein